MTDNSSILSICGRASRKVWAKALVVWLAIDLFALLITAVCVLSRKDQAPPRVVAASENFPFAHLIAPLPTRICEIGEVISAAMFVLLAVWILMLSVRRLHDIGMSGFFILPYLVISGLAYNKISAWPAVLPAPLDLIWLTVLAIVPSDALANNGCSKPPAS